MKKLLRDLKAVSPVLTTVLLILVIVLGMSMLFAYFTSYVADFQLGQGSSVMELIEIEDVWFRDEQKIRITLYNYGKVEIRVTSIYMDDKPVDFLGELGDVNLVEIPVDGHGAIEVQPSDPLTESTSYRFKLVTDRGSVFEGEYVTPSEM